MKRSVFLIFLLIIVLSVYKITSENIRIPNLAIRLRVIPNSNDPKDIYIKEKVKNYLEENIYILTKDTTSIEEARNVIVNNISDIEKNISDIFISNNYSLPYNVNYGANYFPEKTYKGIRYKDGYYESLVIEIGDANGDNWWCVLFPNFCLIDKNNNNSKPKSLIKETITKHKK